MRPRVLEGSKRPSSSAAATAFVCPKTASQRRDLATPPANRKRKFQEFPSGGSKTGFGNALGTVEPRADFAMISGTNPPENLHGVSGLICQGQVVPRPADVDRAVAGEVVRDDRSVFAVWWCLSVEQGNERVDFYGWSLSRAEKRLVRSRRSIFVLTDRGESRE